MATPKKANPGKRGPKGKWGKIDPLVVARAMGALGATEVELAAALGYSKSGLRLLKKQNPQLLTALNESKEQADKQVEQSLFKRAMGYSHPAVKILKTSDDRIITKDYVEHYPPDTTACIFWLKNRKPKEWREQSEHILGTPGKEGELGPLVVQVVAAKENQAKTA